MKVASSPPSRHVRGAMNTSAISVSKGGALLIIIAGHSRIGNVTERDAAVAALASMVESARKQDGCLGRTTERRRGPAAARCGRGSRRRGQKVSPALKRKLGARAMRAASRASPDGLPRRSHPSARFEPAAFFGGREWISLAIICEFIAVGLAHSLSTDSQRRTSRNAHPRAPVGEQPLPTARRCPMQTGGASYSHESSSVSPMIIGVARLAPYKIWQQSRLDLQMSLPQH